MSTSDLTAAPTDTLAGPPASERLPRRTLTVLAVLLVGAFVVILNETAMNVALSRIMSDLNITERTAQWLTTGFMLTMAVVIPISGWFLQRFTTRQAFGLAMSLFSAGTAIAALSPGFELLLTGRIVQASGTAIMMPLLMTTVMELVPPHMRGRVMGTISLVIATAPALGPTVSGIILQFLPWRFVFVMVLPIAVTILIVGLRLVPILNEPRKVELDGWSIPLAAAGFGGLVYGLSLVGNPLIPAWELGVALGVGTLSLTGFIIRQLILQRRDAALLDLRTFTYPTFTIAVSIMAIVMMVLFGSIIATPLVLQKVLNLEPLAVGLMLLPGGLLMGLLGPVVGRLYDKVGARTLVIPGAVVVTGAFAIFATISPATQWWHLLIANLVMSLGLAFMMTPLFTTTLAALPHQLYSYGSAMVGTVQQVAGAAGTALFVTIMATVSAATVNPESAAALATGARTSFLVVGCLWLLTIVGAAFLPKHDPAAVPDPAH
ncbi:MAG: DHA2 family efflux MFS transporter permease subunit [Propionicimonas sp.]